jgi:tetratricopeptide (TPR) repeat protein
LPEPFSAEHLSQLRQRWERDPKSRAFLQLAEEYRRAGRLADAVHVLQAGLKEHPTYLSAQVALGRCLMESGAPEPAAEVLERAVARDPTQLVANKLLVEAYLAKGQSAKARERLDLYKLFNDRDAEIEPLENRIRALEGLPPSGTAPRKAPPRAPRADALFELPGVAALPELRLESALDARAPMAQMASHGEPFGQVHAPGATARIVEAFAQQGIFAIALEPAREVGAVAPSTAAPVASAAEAWPAAAPSIELPETVAPPAARANSLSPVEPVPTETFVAESVSAAPALKQAPEDVAEIAWTPEPSAPPAAKAPAASPALPLPAPPPMPPMPPMPPTLPVSAAPKAASTTLGELYLAQGHFAEAEEAFQSVLQSRPGDAAALAGLESARQMRGGEAAGFDDDVVEAEESNVIVGGLTARKASLLKDYLARLRQAAKRHVS